MLRKLFTAGCGLTAAIVLSGVNAATFDFANIADGTPSSATLDSYTGSVGPGPFTGELGAAAMMFSSDGIGLTATGFSTAGATYNAYLDSTWNHSGGGGQGGLGVCATVSASKQCTPSSDDNVTLGEVLVLEFAQTVTITDITFINGAHNPTFAGDAVFGLIIDGVDQGNQSLVNIYSTSLTGKKFQLINDYPNLDTDLYRFYVNTMTAVIPVPAAVWLFGSGLLGLVAVARRRT